jgi:hypothetical protein
LEFIFSSSSANTEDFTVSNFPASFSHEENEAGKFETVKSSVFAEDEEKINSKKLKSEILDQQ